MFCDEWLVNEQLPKKISLEGEDLDQLVPHLEEILEELNQVQVFYHN